MQYSKDFDKDADICGPITFRVSGKKFTVKGEFPTSRVKEIDAIGTGPEDSPALDTSAMRLAAYCGVDVAEFDGVDMRKVLAALMYVRDSMISQAVPSIGNPTKPEPPKSEK